jgi:Tfp pilus assembly PilM family ATPase
LAEQAVFRRLPANIFADGKIREWGIVHSVLDDVVREAGWAGMAAAIQLPANLVRMQKMQIPYGMKNDAILDEIKLQVERDFRGMGGALSIDFHVDSCKEAGFSQVYFAVTRQEYVTQYVDCIHAAGLKVKMVDVDLYALKRLFAHVIPGEEINAMLCEMESEVLLVISDCHEILFHHQWKAEGEDELYAELKNRITTFQAMFPDKKIKKLMVCSQYQIHFNGDIEIEYPDPFSVISFKQEIKCENLSGYLIACGLAMRELPKW